MNKAFCIIGLYRSGTSLVAQAVRSAGVWMGDDNELLPPSPGINDDGVFEHAGIVDLHQRILRHFDMDKRYLSRPLPDRWWLQPAMMPFRQELLQLVEQRFRSSPRWGWKDPRACLLFPLWQEALGELGIAPHAIIPFRNPLDVANSMARVWNLPRAQCLRLWLYHMLAVREMVRDIPHCFVDYDDLIEHPEPTLNRLLAFLGKENRPDNDLLQLVRPGHRHCRTSLAELQMAVPPEIVALYQEFRGHRPADSGKLLIRNTANYRRLAELADFGRCDLLGFRQTTALLPDFGNGISQSANDNLIKIVSSSPDGRFEVTFQLSRKGIRKLLFSPGFGRILRCRIMRVEADGIPCQAKPGNAIVSEDGWETFLPEPMPFYELKGDFSATAQVRISGILAFAPQPAMLWVRTEGSSI